MKLYKLKCISGGAGWGEAGAEALMCAPDEAFVKNNVPGGWIYEYVSETEDTYYLKHIQKDEKQ